MSTKTTFKRVALVTVAAMGFGLLSVAPSTAVTQADTLAVSATAGATTVSYGSAASTTLTQTFLGQGSDTMTVTVSLVSAPTGYAAVPTLTVLAGQAENGLPTVSGLVGTMFDSNSNGLTYNVAKAVYTLGLTGPLTLAGTYVVRVTPANVTAAPILATQAAAVTWTVTVGAQAAASPADSTSYAVLYKSSTVGSGSTSDTVIVPLSTGSAVAVIMVKPLVDSATATGSTTLVATIAGPGSLRNVTTVAAGGSSTGARSVTTTDSGGTFYVYVHGDGTSGTSTITLTMGTVVLTKTVKFYGAAASVTSTLRVPVIHSGSGAASTGSVMSALVSDANGNPVPGVTVYAISGTTTAMASTSATTGSTGIAYFSFTGLVAGTSAITVQNVATGSTATYSAAPLSVRAGDNVGTSVTMTLDKATYAQGEAAILTVTVKDAAGNLVAPGTVAALSSAGAICSRACTGATLPGASHVTTGSANGSVTYAINVPTTSGAFTISATQGADMLNAGSAISVSATVSQSAAEVAAAAAIAAAADIASAAVDAAAEATDAANAATDAANAAAEAADAATAAAQDAADAVASLATAVAELMADLKAQIAAQKAAITALTNLVIKIQKKLKA